jgi:alcohol dehydrogenase class IV
MRETWTFHSAGQILFGRGGAAQIGEICRQLGGRRVLIVTDPVLTRTGLLDRIRQPLITAGLTVEAFTEGEPEPSMKAALACYDLTGKFRPDVFVGLGGGSNMDLAKIAAALTSHGGKIHDFVGDGKIPGPILPLVCVPTTAGTGSEVSAAAVLTDTDNKIKVGILSNFLRPRVALVDPLLTVSCPAKVTADSGIDALTHAIEAYTAVDNAEFPLPEGEKSVYQGKHPLGDIMAEKAISLVGEFLERAVRDGNDLDAREGMALAALLGGLAFSNVGVAVVHALEYPLGGLVHCSHGAGNGLLLPYVMRFNLPVRPKQFAMIAQLLGEKVDGLDERMAAEKSIVAVEKLRAAIKIPARLRDINVRPENLLPMAEKAFAIKRVLRVNPRTVSLEDLHAILEAAY